MIPARHKLIIPWRGISQPFQSLTAKWQGNNSFQKKHHTMDSLEVWDGFEFLQKLGIDAISMEKVPVIEALQ